ncbi:MAG: methyl-accepting chemotaxis protein [Sulfitobacter sp.]
MNQQVSIAPDGEFLKQDQTLFQQRRMAIDLIATTRARAVRCTVFCAYLQRKHPTQSDEDHQRQSWIGGLAEQRDGICRALGIVKGKDPAGEVSKDICTWINECATNYPEQVAVLEKMAKMTTELAQAAITSDDQFDTLLAAHALFGKDQLFKAVTELCDGFWADLDHNRQVEVALAADANKAIVVALDRMQYIGRHVRLVSLNASVESARVGEEGKGLSVIAQEFKSLAEEIQHLASSAKEEIDGLVPSDK